MLYPISFSIPACKIVQEVPVKKRYLSRMIPGNPESYIYETEEDYYQQYKDSLFAKTTKKAGWDCLRHYEILANGAIPYFPELPHCPPQTMATFPKDLILRGNQLFEKGASREECRELLQDLLSYTRTHLTTEAVARSILDKTYPQAKKILFLSEIRYPDYLHCLTLHGFKTILGKNTHDIPRMNYLYTDCTISTDTLYGNGFTYGRLLDPVLHDPRLTQTVEDDIRNRLYDLIVYGNIHRGMPLYSLVLQHYPPSRVILMDGEDIHTCDRTMYVRMGHPVFVREL